MRRWLSVFAVLMLALPAVARAAETAADDGGAATEETGSETDDDWGSDDLELDDLLDSPITEGDDWDEVKRPRVYPWFEHHGYFRFRADLFWRAHLGNDAIIPSAGATSSTSGFLPPLTHNYENNQAGSGVFDPEDVGRGRDDETIAGANLRLRYTPTLHIAPDLRIGAQFDILDNLVMGSTPDFSGSPSLLRPDVPFVAFTQTQAPPTSGVTSYRDAIRVKQAYGEWELLFNAGTLRFGRMAWDWGLGVTASGGQDPDDDFGDFMDRVEWVGYFFDYLYVSVAYDIASTGPISGGPGDLYGQPYDLDEADDVGQVVISVFHRPLTEEAREERRKDLIDRHRPVIDWGVFNLYRWQDLDLDFESSSAFAANPGNGDIAWDDIRYVQRDAQLWMPDVWVRFEWRPDVSKILHIELEAVMAYGRFNANFEMGPDTEADRREILQFGGVLQADYTTGGLSFGLELGLASGDDGEGLGVLGSSNLVTVDSNGNPQLTNNQRLTNFVFDRDYHVDLLLFRQVIGAVTNTFYFKPFVQYDLFDGEKDALAARLDILYARALEPEATPGNDPNYGLELDLRIFYEEQGRFLAALEWGILFPFAAFDRIDGWDGYSGGTMSSRWSTTIQARVHWMF